MNTTLSQPERIRSSGPDRSVEVGPALVVQWWQGNADRVGEVLLFPNSAETKVFIFGRGDGEVLPGERRVNLVRQRPGDSTPAADVDSKYVSRRQLRIECSAGGLEVENLGRCVMYINGRIEQKPRLEIGDVLELDRQIVLLCVQRPLYLPPWPEGRVYPKFPFGAPDPFHIVGESPAIWELRHRIAIAASSKHPVLVLGSTGVGKELVANAIHTSSSRSKKPLHARSAATIPEGIAELELFGAVKDYPNPGSPARSGLFSQAEGSTLFLDEIGELAHNLQARLLRVMEEKMNKPLGCKDQGEKVDVRIIAATNRLEAELKHDLAPRFTSRIHVPDLSQRREDIPLLARHLLKTLLPKLTAGQASEVPDTERLISCRLVTALVCRDYPTNVRGLGNLLMRCYEQSPGAELNPTRDMNEELVQSLEGRRDPGVQRDDLVGPDDIHVFGDEERMLIVAFRRYQFSMLRYEQMEQGRVARQTAKKRLNVMISKALIYARWNLPKALSILRGWDHIDLGAELRDKAYQNVKGSVGTFLINLHPQDQMKSLEEGAQAKRLKEYYGKSYDYVAQVIQALDDGRIIGWDQGGTWKIDDLDEVDGKNE